jgi:leucyl-tRNA synthetase
VGGPEGDEDLVQAGLREIREETGYLHAKFVKQLPGKVHAQFYQLLKKVNRSAHFQALYFELEDGKQEEVSAEELAIHDLHWVEADKIEEFLTVTDMTIMWRKLRGTEQPWTGEGIYVNSGFLDGKETSEGSKLVIEWLEQHGHGRAKVQYKLRDWIFSRQHYWGEPIPIIHCPKCGALPVPEDQLPVELPKVDHYEPTDTGESPLANMREWVEVDCPKCEGPAERETDTMPNWAGSSWYFLRYLDPDNEEHFAGRAQLEQWLPVDLYNGGMEHTTLHLLYSRFWHKFLFDQKLVPTSEPYARRRSHGMVLGPDGKKMSKSLGNVINPDEVIKHYGADSLRLYELFMGPFEDTTAWSDERLAGVSRFLGRVWTLAQRLMAIPEGTTTAEPKTRALEQATHQAIKKVTEDIQAMHFNTMVSALMEYVNLLTRLLGEGSLPSPQARHSLQTLVLLLAPAAPHAAEELWQQMGERGSVFEQAWPTYDAKLAMADEVTWAVQVNSKLRGTLNLPAGAAEAEVVHAARALERVQTHLEGQKLAKTIFVKDKLVNFVIE